jgi:hypothetical protein
VSIDGSEGNSYLCTGSFGYPIEHPVVVEVSYRPHTRLFATAYMPARYPSKRPSPSLKTDEHETNRTGGRQVPPH